MAPNHSPKTWRKPISLVLIVALGSIVLLTLLSGWIEEGLWMMQLGYGGVFWRLLTVRLVAFVAAFAVTFLYVWLNLRFTVRRGGRSLEGVDRGEWPPMAAWLFDPAATRRLQMLVPLVAAVVATMAGLVFYAQWDTYLRMRFGGSFGITEPMFGQDAGFQVFRLPFYELLQNGIATITALTLVLAVGTHAAFRLLRLDRRPFWRDAPVGQFSLLALAYVGSIGCGFWLDRFELLFATRGVVYGAGFTDANVTRVGLDIMLVASGSLGLLVALYPRIRRLPVLLYSLGGYGALYVVAILVVPALVQRYHVLPNELELESPYLKRNIQLTRRAYGIDHVENKSYPGLADLTMADMDDNQETIRNIRLWDWRPILKTYRQTQEIRLYYQFYDVDVDRYHLDDGYHQVMLAPRELAAEFPAKTLTWVNQRLQFTHGYGLVESFVSHIRQGGLPEYLIEDIPPTSHYGQKIVQPAIYYGEMTRGHRIVNTKVMEFDYPKGEKNVYVHYDGRGGIPLGSLWRRLLFSWTRVDVNIALSPALTAQSRIQIWRTVQERVNKIAPFLRLDHDPYLVLSEGKLFWVQDAYTASDHFPYSQPHEGTRINYIRNSVKVVVNAYDGDVAFYVADPKDPVLKVYRRAFPTMFRDLAKMPSDLRQHLRYPEDLFAIQSEIYSSYHMTVPRVFYNQEDLWASSNEQYGGKSIPMQPYYVLVRLPQTHTLQYLLMAPFTPDKRDNMIAWMAAKCDPAEYGRLEVYRLPKERLVYGPVQVEAMIDQNTTISQQLSLWDQRGSRVIRGNLLVIPIANSFLYVEPVYLTAETESIPQLKRVIVASGDKVVMQPTLDEALRQVFGEAPATPPPEPRASLPRPAEMDKARGELDEAERALTKSNWIAFGQAMQQLEESLAPPRQPQPRGSVASPAQ